MLAVLPLGEDGDRAGREVEVAVATLRRLLRACGFDVSVSLIPYAPDPEREARLEAIRRETPKERLARLLDELEG